MTKQEFFAELRKRLSGLPEQDIEESVNFYGEMIDDRIEEGSAEEEAVSDIGSPDEIAARIISDTPFARIAKERVKPKRHLEAWEILLIVLGCPLWLSLAIGAVSVVLSLYAVLWSLIISLWAVFASFAACSVLVISGIILAILGDGLSGIATAGVGIACIGLSVFLFFGCKAATEGVILLTKKIALGIKKCFVGKEKPA